MLNDNDVGLKTTGDAPMDHNLLRHISSICNQLPAMTSKSFDAAFLQVCACYQSALICYSGDV